MIKRIVTCVALLLGLSLPLVAQDYVVALPTAVGRSTYPARYFNIPLTNQVGNPATAQISWLEVGTNTSCAGQLSLPLGFVFLIVNGVGLPCAPLVVNSDGSYPGAGCGSANATFQGVDANGQPFGGVIQLQGHCYVSGYGRMRGTYQEVDSGVVQLLRSPPLLTY